MSIDTPLQSPSGRPPPARLGETLRALLALTLALPIPVALACSTVAAPPPDSTPEPDEGDCGSERVAPQPFGEDGSCGSFVRLPCGFPSSLRGIACNPQPYLCVAACPDQAFISCNFPAPTCIDGGLTPDAATYLDCRTCTTSVGRRPVGLVPRRVRREPRRSSPLGRYFAEVAYLEAASIRAFRELRARLTAFGAPARLRNAARRAARDETRHARITAGFARRHGAQVESPRASVPALLTFEELAIDNAVEGCVKETFGALIALHQAARAADPSIARALDRIARDEIRHAELAWDIHRWTSARLDDGARRRLWAAQARALAELDAGIGTWPRSVIAHAGAPDATTERALLGGFARAFFGVAGVRGD